MEAGVLPEQGKAMRTDAPMHGKSEGSVSPDDQDFFDFSKVPK